MGVVLQMDQDPSSNRGQKPKRLNKYIYKFRHVEFLKGEIWQIKMQKINDFAF
jgi:hypothetical protein